MSENRQPATLGRCGGPVSHSQRPVVPMAWGGAAGRSPEDYFTKWMEAYPLPDQVATTMAEDLVQGMFSRSGTPSELHSDQGRNF